MNRKDLEAAVLRQQKKMGVLSIKIESVKPPSKNHISTHGPNLVEVTVNGSMDDFKSGRLMDAATKEARKYWSNPKVYKKQGGQYDDDAYELYVSFEDWS